MSLSDFEGQPVIGSQVKITGAGDGLSPALKSEPVEYRLDHEVTVVLRATVSQVNHREAKDGGLIRVHTLKTTTATVIPETGPIKKALDAAAEHAKVEAAKAKGGNIQLINTVPDDKWDDEPAEG